MPLVQPTTIAMGRHDHVLVLRPAGPQTAVVWTRVKRFIKGCRPPETTDVYFDLSRTDQVDSTFLGMILSLTVRKGDAAGPSVHLLDPTPGVLRVLELTHVEQLVDICRESPVTIERWEELPGERADKDEVADVVIDAHERLIEADERNAATFGRVVEGLRAHRDKNERVRRSEKWAMRPWREICTCRIILVT